MSHPLPAQPPPGPRRKVKGKVITGVVCLVLAVVGVICCFVFLFLGLFGTDAEVPVDGEPHTVALDGDDERMIYIEDGGDASCEVRDAEGDPVQVDDVQGTMTRSINGEDRVGVGTFDPPGEEVEVTCSGSDQLDAQIGTSAVSGSRLVILGTGFAVSAVLGVAGLVLLVIALVQRVSRSAR